MPRILTLDQTVADKIAAGEVIERPASIVKELIENSLDAHATRISIQIEQGGIKRVQIDDDGVGIEPEDLRLAVKRHATSKLTDAQDLFDIGTMGFRGEALASVAAISKLTIASRTQTAESGWELQVEGGKEIRHGPTARPVGTSVQVLDLFFNTPARRKFLKTPSTEFRYIGDIVRVMALANPDVAFTLRHNNRTVEEFLAVHDHGSRVDKILGENFVEESIAIDITRNRMRLQGWIGSPNFTRSNSSRQFFYVNVRNVQDHLVAHAVRQAYRDVMFHGRHPMFVLFLTIEPTDVDVNVHPTKREVRFRDARAVHDFLMSGIHYQIRASRPGGDQDVAAEFVSLDSFSDRQQPEASYTGNNLSLPLPSYGTRTKVQDFVNDSSIQPDEHPKVNGEENAEDLPPLGFAIAQLKRAYILAENADGLVVVDMHAAHERVLYERLKQERSRHTLGSQRLLLPVVLEVSADEAQLVDESRNTLLEIGLHMEQAGPTQVKIREIPALLTKMNTEQLARDVIEDLKEFDTSLAVQDREDHLLGTFACHSAVRYNDRMSIDEMNALLRAMEQTDNAGYCNHGRPTYRLQSLKELDKVFLRGQ